jgi:hypothetical protein
MAEESGLLKALRVRRKIYGIISLLLMSSGKGKIQRKLCKRLDKLKKASNQRRDRKAKFKEVESLPDYVFKAIFRISKVDVEELLVCHK